MVVQATLPAEQASSDVALHRSVAVPEGFGGFLAWLLSLDRLLLLCARLGAWLGRLIGRPLRLGGTVLVARHADCVEMLGRDLDYRIAPPGAPAHGLDGPFLLDLDRGAQLETERRAAYVAFAAIDLGALEAAASAHADRLLDAVGEGPIDAVGGYARLVAGGTASRLFGIAPADEPLFLDVARSLHHHGSAPRAAARAVRASAMLRRWLEDEIARRREEGELGRDYMGALLRDPTIDDDAVRRLLGGMLGASIDPTASALARIAILLCRDPALRAAAEADARDREKMLGWCREAMRRWPNSPILQRRAAAESRLGKARVPAGARLIGWTQAAMHDAGAFPEPARMIAGRSPAAYLHFGGGLHPCAGRLVSHWQLSLLAGKLLERGFARDGRLGWAGPFPAHLPVRLTRPRP